MLTCIYHPLDHFRVVEHDEAERLIESGVWFDCPAKARAYKLLRRMCGTKRRRLQSQRLKDKLRRNNHER